MTALLALIPRWMLLTAVAALAVLSGLQAVQLLGSRSNLANARLEAATLRIAIADANTLAAETATKNFAIALKAQNEAHKREEGLRLAADSARRESDGLRNDAESLRLQLEAGTREAAIDRAAAVATVLGQCAARYQVLAERSDRHVNDLRTLIDGWPR